jgi:signal transduction histidine kinase
MNMKKIKLLLIEDNPGDIRLIREMLADVRMSNPEAPFFDLHYANRLSEGLEYLDSEAMDAVLLDLVLPDSQALDTFREVRNQKPRIPIVVLTGIEDEALGMAAVQEGAQDYLVKDEVTGYLLVRSVRYAVERKRTEETLRQYTERLQTLHEIDRAILAAESPDAIADAALHHIRRLIPCQQVSLVTFDLEADEATVFAAYSNGQVPIKTGKRLPLSDFNVSQLEEGQAQLVKDTSELIDSAPGSRALEIEQLRSFINVPLLYQERLIGSLSLGADSPQMFTSEHLNIAREVADSLSTAISQARLHQEVQDHAQELSRAVERLQELDNLKSEFIQNVSHELRSPLALIRGYAEMLSIGALGTLEPEQEIPVRIISRRAQMLGDLVDDITNLLAVETRPMSEAPVAVDSLTQTAVEDFRVAAQQAGLVLEAEIAPELPRISGDVQYLRRVLDNLLSNAIKFTPVGGRVSVRLWPEADQLLLQVADTGVGIPDEEKERIFDRFYQIDGSTRRRYGGMGLGLALVNEIVEAHGGRVKVDSQEGQGSAFTVSLPVMRG